MRTSVNPASVFLFIFCSTVCVYGAIGANRYLKYNTGGNIVESKLNVHLVPHSHDDVGWLKTVDQYYVGSNNSIQVIFTSYIQIGNYVLAVVSKK